MSRMWTCALSQVNMDLKIQLLQEYANTHLCPPPIRCRISHNEVDVPIGWFWESVKHDYVSVAVACAVLENEILRFSYLDTKRRLLEKKKIK